VGAERVRGGEGRASSEASQTFRPATSVLFALWLQPVVLVGIPILAALTGGPGLSLAIVFAPYGLVAAVYAIRGRVIVTGDDVEVVSLRRRRVPRGEIVGIRLYLRDTFEFELADGSTMFGSTRTADGNRPLFELLDVPVTFRWARGWKDLLTIAGCVAYAFVMTFIAAWIAPEDDASNRAPTAVEIRQALCRDSSSSPEPVLPPDECGPTTTRS
jgi:hypothetical protein